MITIKVFREFGHAPAAGKEVTIATGYGTSKARTDRNGSAHFEVASGKSFKVYVDGKEVYHGPIVGTQVVYA